MRKWTSIFSVRREKTSRNPFVLFGNLSCEIRQQCVYVCRNEYFVWKNVIPQLHWLFHIYLRTSYMMCSLKRTSASITFNIYEMFRFSFVVLCVVVFRRYARVHLFGIELSCKIERCVYFKCVCLNCGSRNTVSSWNCASESSHHSIPFVICSVCLSLSAWLARYSEWFSR